MPMMPRPSGKAREIAYKILGVPANMVVHRSKKRKKIDERLLYEETFRVR